VEAFFGDCFDCDCLEVDRLGAGAASVPMAALDPLKGVRIVLTFEEGSGYSGTLTREIALGPQ
jgi:hypothetical protein